MSKRTIKIILITLALFVAVLAYCTMSKKIDKLEYANKCVTEGLLCSGLSSEAYLAKTFRNSKIIIFERNTDLKEVIDTLAVSVVEDSENPHVVSITFDKPITTKADWKIALTNGNDIVISDIETSIVDHHTMLGENLNCEVINYKINGKQSNGEFDILE